MNSTLAYLESLAIGGGSSSEVQPEVAEAIAKRDRAALIELLGARHNIVCAVFPVDPDRKEEDQEEQEDEPEAPKQRAA